MKSDLSRALPREPLYRRVLLQQGRPLSDAEFNAQTDSLLALAQQMAEDFIGEHGTPGRLEGTGAAEKLVSDNFRIERVGTAGGVDDLRIGPGPYYVAGLRCENKGGELLKGTAAPAPGSAKNTTYLDQPYFPALASAAPRKEDLGDTVLVYLDVWEHHRTWIDDARILDPSFGGIDLATRSELVWQVKVLPDATMENTDATTLRAALEIKPADVDKKAEGAARDVLEAGLELKTTRGLLRPRISPVAAEAGRCHVQPEARHRAENQLYRVEIHRGGRAWQPKDDEAWLKQDDKDKKVADAAKAQLARVATFKWSRENGSVAAAWLEPRPGDGATALQIAGPRDQAHGFTAGQRVEITDERRALRGEPGIFVRLASVEGGTLTLEGGAPNRADFPLHPVIRRWDHVARGAEPLIGGALVIREQPDDADPDDNETQGKIFKPWIELEKGIEISFRAPEKTATVPTPLPHHYRTGDYWIITTRTNGEILDWPLDPAAGAATTAARLQALAPHGITHYYAPLAIIKKGPPATDIELRRVFVPLARRAKG